MLVSDPRVAALPVVEAGDPLVDLAGFTRVRIDPRKSAPGGGWRQVRASLADRLAVAAASLPAGVELLIVEGLRSPAWQRHYWENYRTELLAHYPGLPEDELYRLASRWVAPPELAPHCTGGAVDLTLCDTAGNELDLGSPLDATPEQSSGACFTATVVPGPGAAHRAVLVTALSGAGLVNYPTEWWHWSFGDRYWAFSTGAPHALFGPVEHPG